MSQRRRESSFTLTLLLACACVSDDPSGDDPDPGDDADPSGAESGDVEGFLASTSVPSADDFFTLVGVVPSLDEPEARLEDSVEYPGFATVIRSPAIPNAYFVGSGEAPTVRRYELGEDGVVPGSELSMAAYGLTYAPGPTETEFAPDGLAYSVNYDNEIVIVWSPSEMTIDRTIAIEGLTREGYSSVYPISIAIQDGHLLFPVSYGNFETGAGLPLTVLGSVDLATDAVELVEDDRCSGIRSLIPAPDGTLYAATDGFFATRYRLYGEAAGTEPCILRVRPGQTSFDPSFRVATSTLVDDVLAEAAIAGDLNVSADGQRFLFNAFDESLAPIASDATYVDVASATGWLVHEISVASVASGMPSGAQAVTGLAAGAREGLVFKVDGRTWVAVSSADYGSSRIFDVSRSGETTEGPRFTGSLSTLSALN